MSALPGTLYIVPTPIGNLGDITSRAKDILSHVDFIAAEDTRVTVKLLNHCGLKKPLVSYFEHNRRESGARIVRRLVDGESAALVSDAGTPLISDPGEDLILLCERAHIPVVALPGPCALVTALSVSGLPCGRFCFEGFLSVNKKNRRLHLLAIKKEPRTMVFYEAPHKLPYTLTDLLETLGDRRVTVCRELTKLHEETLRTTLAGAIRHFSVVPPQGEFVLVVEGAPTCPPSPADAEPEAVARAKAYLEAGDSLRDAARRAAEETGAPRGHVYAALLNKGRASPSGGG